MDRIDGGVLHQPPPAEHLPARLQALCDFANGDSDDEDTFIHPVVRAILLHFWLAYDHPFEDGNGRTARVLFSWFMRTKGYWLVEYLSISKILREAPGQYNRAFLLTETDEGDTTYFLIHQLGVIERAIDELHKYLRRKVAEVRDVERLCAARAASTTGRPTCSAARCATPTAPTPSPRTPTRTASRTRRRAPTCATSPTASCW